MWEGLAYGPSKTIVSQNVCRISWGFAVSSYCKAKKVLNYCCCCVFFHKWHLNVLKPERLEFTFKTLWSLGFAIEEVKNVSGWQRKTLVLPSHKVSHLPFTTPQGFEILNNNILCWWTGDTWQRKWWASNILQMRGGTKGSYNLKWQIKSGKLTERSGYWKLVWIIKWWRVKSRNN